MTSRTGVLSGLLIGLVAAVLGLWWAQPPDAVNARADTGSFSSARAMVDVEALAAEARPLGTRAHDRARQYLARRLEGLGLEIEEQEATASRTRRSGRVEAARVHNLLARRRGRGIPGAVLLLVHYDSRPQTFGAADDAAGVATVLEALRALAAEPRMQRDILVAVTDGEELGLFGARAFVDQHPWAQEVEFLINIEARGNRGPSMMFETTPGNLELVRAFAAEAPFPFGNSLTYEVYRRMPNDSDFSAFRAASVAGLNFAMIGNHPAYHTRLDSADRLDPRSLQHHGANVLALSRYLANLSQFPRSGEDAVYFSILPWWLVVYPASTARVLGVGLLLMAGVALWRSGRSGIWTPGGLARGAALALAAAVGGYLVGFAFWKVLQFVGPALLAAPHGRPYRTLWFGVAIALLVGALVTTLARRLQVAERSLELLAGALVVWTLGAVALSFWISGASFLLTWPACSAWIGWWIVARLGESKVAGGTQIVTALGAVAGVLLFAPLLVLFLQALTLSGAGVPAALLGLLLTLFVTQLVHLSDSARLSLALCAAAAGVVLLAAFLSGQSAARPRPDTLFYVESDEGSYWYSMDSRPDAWTSDYLGTSPEKLPAPAYLSLGSRTLLRAGARRVGLDMPWIEVIDPEAGDDHAVAVNVGASNGGQILRLRATTTTAIEGVWLGDTRFEIERSAGEIWMTLIGPSSGAQPWRLRFAVAGSEPLSLEVLEQRFGLPSGENAPAPRPADLIPSSSWRTDSTYVLRRVTL